MLSIFIVNYILKIQVNLGKLEEEKENIYFHDDIVLVRNAKMSVIMAYLFLRLKLGQFKIIEALRMLWTVKESESYISMCVYMHVYNFD